MNRTSPVQIINKNGVTTTVHKRVDAAVGSAKPSAIPKPSIHGTGPQDTAAEVVAGSLAMTLASHELSEAAEARLMTTLHPGTMAALEEMHRRDLPHTGVRRAMNWSIKNRDFALLNTMVVLFMESEIPDKDRQDEKIAYILTGMQNHRVKGTPQIDITKADDPRSAGIRDLVRVLSDVEPELTDQRVNTKYQKSITFADPDVGNLILDRPERADEIVGMYRSRGAFDRSLFESALDSGVPALNEGTL
jgi:hypothetical protein